jgi:hypothetical protein
MNNPNPVVVVEALRWISSVNRYFGFGVRAREALPHAEAIAEELGRLRAALEEIAAGSSGWAVSIARNALAEDQS